MIPISNYLKDYMPNQENNQEKIYKIRKQQWGLPVAMGPQNPTILSVDILSDYTRSYFKVKKCKY